MNLVVAINLIKRLINLTMKLPTWLPTGVAVKMFTGTIKNRFQVQSARLGQELIVIE